MMLPTTLSILLVALSATSVSAKLGMSIGSRNLVVADWSMGCGACDAQILLACKLTDDTNTVYPVECTGCPDCPSPSNAFKCNVTVTDAGITTDTPIDVVLEDGSAVYCKVSSADFTTAYCERHTQ